VPHGVDDVVADLPLSGEASPEPVAGRGSLVSRPRPPLASVLDEFVDACVRLVVTISVSHTGTTANTGMIIPGSVTSPPPPAAFSK